MTTLIDNCSVDVLRQQSWKPHKKNIDRQLLGGCIKTTPPDTINDKTERQFQGEFNNPTPPLELLNNKNDKQIHGGCNKTTVLEQLYYKIDRKVLVGCTKTIPLEPAQ